MSLTPTTQQPESVATTEMNNEKAAVYRPDVDILESAEQIDILIDLPGVPSENIDVDFEKGLLTITGRAPRVTREGRCLMREFSGGDFHRSFRLSEGVNADGISAAMKDGVLTLTLPKSEQTRPSKIQVHSN
jgi:HSP20 family protein